MLARYMKITNLSLEVGDIALTARFFEQRLELPATIGNGVAIIEIGYTRIELKEGNDREGVHHLAITIPTNKFAGAKRWLQKRVALLKHDGADEFETAPSWNARSLYFDGPDGSILELIVRRDLENATDGPFSSTDLLGVSEVGVVVPDVRTVAAMLESDALIPPYGWIPFHDFAPVGDVEGLLILVGANRPWFPTVDRVSSGSPIEIDALGERSGEYSLGPASRLRVSAAPAGSGGLQSPVSRAARFSANPDFLS